MFMGSTDLASFNQYIADDHFFDLHVLPQICSYDTCTMTVFSRLFTLAIKFNSLFLKSKILLSHVYIQEYEEEHSKLVSVVTSMEQNIKALLKDFDSKKKVNVIKS